MKTADKQKQPGTGKPKAKLSPDVAEFLHMLKSLETEFGEATSPAR